MSQRPRRQASEAPKDGAQPASATRLVVAGGQDVRTKGTSIAAIVGYVRKEYAEEGLARMAAGLQSPEAARHLGELVLRGSWYPFEDYIALLEAGDAVFPGSKSFAWREGAFGADTDLRGVYRAFVRLASPRFLIERAGHVWKQYYTSGELRILDTSNAHVAFELDGFASPHRLHCDAVLGWATRAAELTGVTDVRDQHTTCRARGGAHCRFRLDWR